MAIWRGFNWPTIITHSFKKQPPLEEIFLCCSLGLSTFLPVPEPPNPNRTWSHTAGVFFFFSSSSFSPSWIYFLSNFLAFLANNGALYTCVLLKLSLASIVSAHNVGMARQADRQGRGIASHMIVAFGERAKCKIIKASLSLWKYASKKLQLIMESNRTWASFLFALTVTYLQYVDSTGARHVLLLMRGRVAKLKSEKKKKWKKKWKVPRDCT